jgi:hypothetical protein
MENRAEWRAARRLDGRRAWRSGGREAACLARLGLGRLCEPPGADPHVGWGDWEKNSVARSALSTILTLAVK